MLCGLELYSSYEAEIQFVHYKSSYDNLTEAVADNQTDSLAIVAVLGRKLLLNYWKLSKDFCIRKYN